MIKTALLPALLLGLSIAFGQALALKTFQDGGTLISFNRQEIWLADRSYHLLATTKVFLKNHNAGNLSDLKPGQTVMLEIFKLDEKYLVDSIQILKP